MNTTTPWDALQTRFAGYRALFETTIAGAAHREIAECMQERRNEELSEEELEWFSAELATLLHDFLAVIEIPEDEPTSLEPWTQRGLIWLDHELATFTQDFGEEGKDYAEFVVEIGQDLLNENLRPEDVATRIVNENWQHWETKKRAKHAWPICFLNIAQTYFFDVLKDELEAKREEKRAEQLRRQKTPPGLQDEVSRTISRAFFEPKNKVQRGIVRPYIVVNSSRHIVAYSNTEVLGPKQAQGELDAMVLRSLQHRMQHGLKLLRTVSAHRLIRWIAQECATRYRDGKSFGESRQLRWRGGIERLAEMIDEPNPSSGKVQHKLKHILEAGRCLRIEWPNGARIGGLWMERLGVASGWKGAWGELDVAPFFVPGFAHRYRLSSHQIVPIVPLPPGIQKANSKHQGALAACQLELVTLMTERKAQLAQYGGALITEEERARMACLYGLKPQIFEGYFEQWQRDTEYGARMLEESEPDRYHLADNELFGAAHTFLLEGGRRSRAGRLRGKNGKKKA